MQNTWINVYDALPFALVNMARVVANDERFHLVGLDLGPGTAASRIQRSHQFLHRDNARVFGVSLANLGDRGARNVCLVSKFVRLLSGHGFQLGLEFCEFHVPILSEDGQLFKQYHPLTDRYLP